MVYAKTGNPQLAYRTAGYSPKNARVLSWRLRQKPVMRQRIKELVRNSMSVLGIDEKYILGGIKAIADKEDAADRDRLNAYTRLGENLALWKEKRPVGKDPKFERLDTITLVNRLAGALVSLGPEAVEQFRRLLERSSQVPAPISHESSAVQVDVCGEPGREDNGGVSGSGRPSNGVASIQRSKDSKQGMGCVSGLPSDDGHSNAHGGVLPSKEHDRVPKQS